MKRLYVGSILIVLLVSGALLLLDSQSKQGVINDLKKQQTTDNKNTENEIEKTSKQKQTEVDSNTFKKHVVEKKTYTIVIDPGHQEKANLEQEPIDPGATETKPKVTGGTTGVVTNKPEYVLTLEASILLKDYLEEKEFNVILTRTAHDVDVSNSERAQIANDANADLFVRIHADGAETAEPFGFSLLVPGKENEYTKDIYQDSMLAATTILTKVDEKIPLLHNGIFQRGDIAGFNWSEVPVVLVELGFMTNEEEDRKLADETYLADLTRMLADGIEAYVIEKEQ